MREQLAFAIAIVVSSGFTPACAGTTDMGVVSEAVGEGSPPHVREQRAILGGFYIHGGFTPACAGTTSRCSVKLF